MQVLCKASHTGSDVRCRICGQGFLVYWTRSAPAERERRREQIVNALRAHHIADQSAAAHPEDSFSLPERGSDLSHPGAELPSHASSGVFA